MKTLKNNVTIDVTSNKQNKTFTIRLKENGKTYSKYRTLPFTRMEFKDAEYWSQNDWKQYLNSEDSYYKVA